MIRKIKGKVIILLFGFTLLNQAIAQQPAEQSQLAVNRELTGKTRIVISTSGVTEFDSFWLDDPPRLVVEFKSRNVVSKIDKEVIINQGVIKRITTSFFEEKETKPLKSLTFELTQKVPYKIWQENNSILLDIQASLETPVFHIGSEEILTEKETSDVIIKRLEAMDVVLMQVAEGEAPIEIPEVSLETTEAKVIEIDKEIVEEIKKAKEEIVSAKPIVLPEVVSAKESKTMVSMIFWLAGLILISGLGFLLWRRQKLNTDEKLRKLKSELEEKNKRLEQQETIRKAVEKASLQKEKEYQQVKDSFESLKGELIEKGLLKRELSPDEKERPWISGKSQERRQYPRLALSRDYNKTIILRIESSKRPESVKSFANSISSDGLCFETKEEFEKDDLINLRLFFYGDVVPMVKIQALIVWKKVVAPINYYGVYFDLVDKKDEIELGRYIESKIGKE